MALKDTWKDKVDGVDDVLAEDINSIAHSVIELEEGVNEKEKVLFVTVTDGVASHNAIQIAEYADNGYSVYCEPYNDGETRYALSVYSMHDEDNASAKFAFMDAEEGILHVWEIYEDGTTDHYIFNAVLNDDFVAAIGDIETALDSIIAIQESLIGGSV